jgi:GNAT superfamily N-acetyltransferase
MTHPDACCELALVALACHEDREICVAEARYVRSDDIVEGREFALAVADAWQGRGIGKTLLLSLGSHAARHGVERLVGDVLRDNLAMIELARGLGYAVRSHPADARLVRVERSFVPRWPAAAPQSRQPKLHLKHKAGEPDTPKHWQRSTMTAQHSED